jgi:hypothetical protein
MFTAVHEYICELAPVVAHTTGYAVASVRPDDISVADAVAAFPEHEVEDPAMFIDWPLINVATAAAVPDLR